MYTNHGLCCKYGSLNSHVAQRQVLLRHCCFLRWVCLLMYTSQTSSSSFTSLKRARDEKQFPPLPKLTSELILQVYTHISLRRLSEKGPEEYGDNERLIELGKAVLDALITYVLFNKRPMLKVPEICVGPCLLFSNNPGFEQVFLNSIIGINLSRTKTYKSGWRRMEWDSDYVAILIFFQRSILRR